MRIPHVLDVTLRDGGYVNRHAWSLSDAIRVVRAVADGGVLSVEVGYFRPERHDVDGGTVPAASCPPYYLEKLRATAADTTTLVVMVREPVPAAHYRELADLGVGMVRLPTRPTAFDQAEREIAAIHDAGMRAALNLIRVSELDPAAIASAAAVAERAAADVFYLADSNGSLFPEDVPELVEVARQATSVPLGFHAHDGLSLAFGNSLAALAAGCEYVDASLGGLGKGGGNLCLELLASYLRARGEAPFDLTPLALTSADVISPLREGGAMARCESIVSGLLNLNIDEIANLRAKGGVLPLLNS
ncbi:hypothetical protein [Acrocarpospora catenulata]|uniref:hypothetical protein n=1 Tax=Acrocarpospora catenulata TaxID=2836182 RepID=UPI001BDA402B|nr:hypothetical protein [Acrocarpospora catenulata]